MNLPSLIFAEAAVKSSRAGYVSIFDSNAKITAKNLKDFYADPDKMIQAVAAFKAAGFSVLGVDRVSVSIAGSPDVFKSAFKATIIAVDNGTRSAGEPRFALTSEESQRFGIIEVNGSEFEKLVAGIALEQPAQSNCGDEPPPPPKENWSLTPKQIPSKLRSDSLKDDFKGWLPFSPKREQGENIKVAIVDTGRFNHPYFKKEFFDRGSLNIEPIIPSALAAALFNDLDSTSKQLDELEKQLKSADLPKEEQEKLSEQQRDELSGELDSLRDRIAHAKKGIAGQKSWLAPDADDSGHGTAMFANVLPVAPKAAITMIKADITNVNRVGPKQHAISEALEMKPHVISCSWGTPIGKLSPGPILNKYLFSFLIAIIKYKAIILFAAGNKNDKDPEGKDTETQWPEVISVGGAYWDFDLELSASSVGHGYKSKSGRVVPDVCGLCGPSAAPYLILPTQPGSEADKNVAQKPGDWSTKWPGWIASSGGTSSATAQVAGVCALIKQAYPSANTETVRTILKKTATAVTKGKTAQGNSLSDLGAGLVHLEKALDLARNMQIALIKNAEKDNKFKK
ncbi:S8 family serine peptidase [candidate division KSB1 bacterium]|nr:S8 family serine peptidase [candidate division KSB1 bacterium]